MVIDGYELSACLAARRRINTSITLRRVNRTNAYLALQTLEERYPKSCNGLSAEGLLQNIDAKTQLTHTMRITEGGALNLGLILR